MKYYSTDRDLFDYYIGIFRTHFHVVKNDIDHDQRLFSRHVPEIDVWQKRSFFTTLINHASVIDDNGWVLFCVDPDPYLYFFRHFQVLPLISSDSVTSCDEFSQAIYQDPGDSPADAIAYRGEKIVICSRLGSVFFFFDEISEVSAEFIAKRSRPFEKPSQFRGHHNSGDTNSGNSGDTRKFRGHNT